jgi:hypothetical protein
VQSVANTFNGGRLVEYTLAEDLRVQRVFGGEALREGRFFTTSEFSGSTELAKSKLALPTSNTATEAIDAIIPKGTKIYVGEVAPLNGQSGGGYQVFIQNNDLQNAVQFLEETQRTIQ